MANNFIFAYRNIVVDTKRLSKGQIEAGLVIEFNYNGPDAHTEKPLVFVLNPNWEKLLHGIALEHVNLYDFKKLYNNIKLKRESKQETMIKLRLSKLPAKLTINPRAFYKSQIRPFLKSIEDSSYRTYSLKYMSNIKVFNIDLESGAHVDE